MKAARSILDRAGLVPKKSFGQHFLNRTTIVDFIARACVSDMEIGKARVLELGAGLGVLTTALALRAKSVVAIERDRDLIHVLARELEAFIAQGVLQVVEGDAQVQDTRARLGPFEASSPRVLCGNLPYQITGSLIERAVRYADDVERVVFMVQLEVADRLAAKPGSKIYGALSVFTQAAFRVEKLYNVSPGCFYPPPDVTSAVVMFTPLRPRRADETPTFRALVKSAFCMRRKKLRNAWSGVASAEAIAHAAMRSGISLDARGETLSVDQFAAMARALDSRTP
ncbi:MAG: 16S rRNA (adenine(1518)-N(6)/adenine(1519)-N(6))-dimethyltransferase RsmA [Polyangiaceae bacterium]|nr:16S rRNA (adenine(1518)-N(6)/adenine(1519)-N(6))-dimethyltransferase RsmA [Polyangiaceae bacterium]